MKTEASLQHGIKTLNILSCLEKDNYKKYFPDFESIELLERKNYPTYFTTRRKIIFKNVLPRIIALFLPLRIFDQINTYVDYSQWYPRQNYYTFNISCPHWYQTIGSVQFNPLMNNTSIDLQFEITRPHLPQKEWIERIMEPFILNKYLKTIQHINTKLEEESES
jgi:hypothetical protein